jgi:hypothetical protein
MRGWPHRAAWGATMTAREKEVMSFALDKLEGRLQPDPVALRYVGLIREVVNGSHGAASHRPRKPRKAKVASGAEAEA